MAICEGQYGKPVTLEDLQLVAADQCIVLDEDGYLSLRDQKVAVPNIVIRGISMG